MDVQSPAPKLAVFLKSVNLQSILTKKVYTLGYYRALLRLWGRKGKKKKRKRGRRKRRERKKRERRKKRKREREKKGGRGRGIAKKKTLTGKCNQFRVPPTRPPPFRVGWAGWRGGKRRIWPSTAKWLWYIPKFKKNLI